MLTRPWPFSGARPHRETCSPGGGLDSPGLCLTSKQSGAVPGVCQKGLLSPGGCVQTQLGHPGPLGEGEAPPRACL